MYLIKVVTILFHSAPLIHAQRAEATCLNTTDILALFPTPPEKIVLLEYLIVNQSYVPNILDNYPRLRDYHKSPPYWGPYVNLAGIVATSINASLASAFNVCSKAVQMFPVISPGLFSNHWRILSSRKIMEEPIQYNFAYCDRPREVEKETIYAMFRKSADLSVWICLIGSITLIIIIVKVKIEHGSCIFLGKESIIMATMTALLSPGLSAQPRIAQYSMLFSLWMYICLIFVTYYGGSVTSEIISPTPEKRMTTFDELFRNNYSLSYVFPYRFQMAKNIVSLMLQDKNKNDTSVIFKSVKNLDKMLSTVATVAPNPNKWFEVMSTGWKVATVMDWQACIYGINMVKNFMATKMELRRTKCYIGKELAFRNQMFYAFSAGSVEENGRRLKETFMKLVETGFYKIWMKEFNGLATSRRVQDRLRVISPVHIVEDLEGAKALEVEGKVGNIFLLWGICLGCCVLAFLKEIFVEHFLKNKTKAKKSNDEIIFVFSRGRLS